MTDHENEIRGHLRESADGLKSRSTPTPESTKRMREAMDQPPHDAKEEVRRGTDD